MAQATAEHVGKRVGALNAGPSSTEQKRGGDAVRHLLQLPALAFYFGFAIFPLLFTLYLSANNWQLSGEHSLVGLANYTALLHDSAFGTSLVQTAIFVILPVTIEYCAGLGLALLVHRLTRGRSVIRLLALLPMMVSPLVVGVIWKMMFNESYGPVNDVLFRLGVHGQIPWITNPTWAVAAVIIADVWEWTPFVFLILFAAVQSLPGEVFESASVDGANPWQLFRDMIFPLLIPASVTVILIRSIEAFKIFDVIFLMTGGGPGSATESATLYAYDVGLRSGNLGYAAALTIVMLLIVILLATALLALLRVVTNRQATSAKMRSTLDDYYAKAAVSDEALRAPSHEARLTKSARGITVPPAIGSAFGYILIGCWLIFALFPLYWMATTAFKTHLAVYNGPFYVPGGDFKPYFGSWTYLFGSENRDAIIGGILNSVLYASLGAFFSVVIGALAGYGLARYDYKYGPMTNNDLSFLYLSQRIMPPIVAVLGLFMLYRAVGLIDTRVGMILLYTWFNIPISAYLLKDFISGISRDVEYAAAVDGYSKLDQIRLIVLPLAMPGMAAAFLLAFFFAWNDFLLALILTFQKATTLPIIITNFTQRMEPEWGFLSTLGLIAIIPPVIATILLDRILKRGSLFSAAR